MVDIKELMRTYVFLNDPSVREVTTKFGVLLLGLGVAAFAVWGVVNLAEEPVAPSDPQAASSPDDGGADATTECVAADRADDWRNEHRYLILANRLVEVEERGDEVCFTYTS